MTRKKSLLEKWGLVETEEDFDQVNLIESLQLQAREVDEHILESGTSQTTIQFGEGEDFLTVSEAYEEAGLSDLNNSIFKVDEFSRHLPDNLPSDVKRQSVIGILTASGLELEELFEDAEERIVALKGVSVATTEKSNSIITEKEQEITDLLNDIDTLKQDNIDRKAAQEKQDSLIEEELSKINQIVKFISSK